MKDCAEEHVKWSPVGEQGAYEIVLNVKMILNNRVQSAEKILFADVHIIEEIREL